MNDYENGRSSKWSVFNDPGTQTPTWIDMKKSFELFGFWLF